MFLRKIIGICNNLVCFTHLTIAGRKENIPFFLVLSDKMSRININSLDEIFFKNHFPPSLFPRPCLHPHKNSQSRDQQGHFHPLLVIKNTRFSLHLHKRCVLRCEAVTEKEDTSVSLPCTALYNTLHRESTFDNCSATYSQTCRILRLG